MKDKNYKVRTIRLDDKVWEELKKLHNDSGSSWNLLIKQLVCQYQKHYKK